MFYSIRHITRYRYDAPIRESVMQLYMQPKSEGAQRLQSFQVTTQPAHGTLSGTAPNLTYTSARNYHGADSFAFVVNDGLQDGVPATVSLQVVHMEGKHVADESTKKKRCGLGGIFAMILVGAALGLARVRRPG